MPIEINPNTKKIIKNGMKLIDIPCIYSGKKLSPEEIKEMGKDTIPLFYEEIAIKKTLTAEEKVKMQEYIKAMDKMIEKFPDNIDLRTYRAKIAEELRKFS